MLIEQGANTVLPAAMWRLGDVLLHQVKTSAQGVPLKSCWSTSHSLDGETLWGHQQM